MSNTPVSLPSTPTTILTQLSGGYDSIAVAILLQDLGHKIVGLFFDYDQEYAVQEERAAEDVATLLGITLLTVVVDLKQTGQDGPEEYIPLRNLALATLSANVASAEGYEYIAVGNKTTEVRPNDPYSFSDCSIEFYAAVNKAIEVGTEPGQVVPKIVMPLIRDGVAMTKKEVVELVHDRIGEDVAWSCYHPTDAGEPCGTCYHCEEIAKCLE